MRGDHQQGVALHGRVPLPADLQLVRLLRPALQHREGGGDAPPRRQLFQVVNPLVLRVQKIKIRKLALASFYWLDL